jgi:hypothetical protein
MLNKMISNEADAKALETLNNSKKWLVSRVNAQFLKYLLEAKKAINLKKLVVAQQMNGAGTVVSQQQKRKRTPGAASAVGKK